jgi:UDP-glucose 4-epimerase
MVEQNKMNVLVTGGLGYIGSHLVSKLSSEMNVHILDNLNNSEEDTFKKIEKISSCNLNFSNIDLRDSDKVNDLVRKYSINIVFHFAGLKSVNESFEREKDYFEINVKGTQNLLNSLKINDDRNFFIFSSSAAVYGNPLKVPIDESHSLNPINPYGKNKKAAEAILEDFQKDTNISIACLRYFNPVGSHNTLELGDNINEETDGLVSNLLTSIIENKKFNIYGNDYPTEDGTAIRDFIHIDDLIEGHISAFDYMKNNENTFEIFNLGTGKGTTILKFIETFKEVNSLNIKTKFCPRRKGDPISSYADASKAHKLLGWYPKRSIEEMCISTWEYQKKIQNL